MVSSKYTIRKFTKVKGKTIPEVRFSQDNWDKSTVTVFIGNDKGEAFNLLELYELLTSIGCIERDGTLIKSQIPIKIIPLVNGLVEISENKQQTIIT